MKTIGAAEFRQRCLALLDELDDDGVVITKDGRPVALLLPYERRHGELIGSLSHKVKVRGISSARESGGKPAPNPEAHSVVFDVGGALRPWHFRPLVTPAGAQPRAGGHLRTCVLQRQGMDPGSQSGVTVWVAAATPSMLRVQGMTMGRNTG